jgi:hypothetical protein
MNVRLRRVRVTILCRGKAISIQYYELVAVLLPYLFGMQCACSVLYCHLWPARLYNIFPL